MNGGQRPAAPPPPHLDAPASGDGEVQRRAQEGARRWQAALAELAAPEAEAARLFAGTPEGSALLRRIFAHAPFLTEALLAEPALPAALFARSPALWFRKEAARLEAEAAGAAHGENGSKSGSGLGAGAGLGAGETARLLRRARRRHALGAAMVEINRTLPFEEVAQELSRFARQALDIALRTLYAEAQASGRIALAKPPASPPSAPGPSPAPGSSGEALRVRGYALILLGKGGAGELNYSSDVDFFPLFDPEVLAPGPGKRALQQEMNRLTRELVALLSEPGPEGRVFRCDLRLRPDPAAMPLAVALPAALRYYETRGQNWERCAMIKASFAAGDKRLAARFLAEMRRYVWRKYLDFEALSDIHAIKRQIDDRAEPPGPRPEELFGHDLKLGRGGIREIEFFVQTQQLIWGGRDAALRAPRTLDALATLAGAGRIEEETASELRACYRKLRFWEHRLQMAGDAQTHALPATWSDFARFADFCGASSPEALAEEISETLKRVAVRYRRLFESAPALSASGSLSFVGTEPEAGTLATLARMGFADGARVFEVIRAWHHGRLRATAVPRARERLTELVPALLERSAATQDPDETLLRLDRLLSRLPAGLQIFTLLRHNPALLRALVDTLGLSPTLAERLYRRPQLLDSMLDAGFHEPPPERGALEQELAAELNEARDLEEGVRRLAQRVQDRRFQLGYQALHGRLAPGEAARAATRLAEAVLAVLLPALLEGFAKSHGRLQGGAAGFACLALGRLGSGTMGFLSDLDLVFLHDERAEEEESDGPHPLAAPVYWGRFARRVQSTLSAASSEGRLYEVDVRLRPHGPAGGTVFSLAAYRDYHLRDAWAWERMSLARGRVVWGGEAFAGRVEEAVAGLLAAPAKEGHYERAAADMRARLAAERPPRGPLDLRYRFGGIYDLDLLAQARMLARASEDPSVLARNAADIFTALGACGDLPSEEAAFLSSAHRFYEDLRWYLQLTAGPEVRAQAVGPLLAAGLARAGGEEDFAGVLARVESSAERVRAVWDARIAPGPWHETGDGSREEAGTGSP